MVIAIQMKWYYIIDEEASQAIDRYREIDINQQSIQYYWSDG